MKIRAIVLVVSASMAGASSLAAFPRHSYGSKAPTAYRLKGVNSYHSGYMKKSGTYVMPHYQTAPNRTKVDNWSSRPNVNPYTGKLGTKDPYETGH